MNIPTALTTLRMLLIPVFLLFFCGQNTWGHWLALLLFVVSALTDWLDGFLARSRGETTPLGAFLDPVADKLLVMTALILVVGQAGNRALTVAAVLLIGRELLVVSLRAWMAQRQHVSPVQVCRSGKIKTVVHMVALCLLIGYYPDGPLWVFEWGCILLYGSVLLSLWSMGHYVYASWPYLSSNARKHPRE